ncbi:MAG: CHASE2 domain-containing protein [Plectolyngbya sp. WJT66-NPBG17]|jgi:CHASE2 domain-containing sensor protein/two-component sensor histidine kinase|nr:CHASE2 domain-containing protein [Plectolyngbya sp. WJT66-NPBG17]
MNGKRWQAVRAEIQAWRHGALPGLVVIVGVTIARFYGVLQPFELMAFDQLLRLRPLEPMDDRITIVGITEADIQRTKAYPIPDGVIADLFQRLQTYQPTVIGLDIVRDIPVEPGHAALESLFRTRRNIIGAEIALPGRHGFTVRAPAALDFEQIGFADVVPDEDGNHRRSLLAAASSTSRQDYPFSFSLRVAQHYLAAQGIELENGIRDTDAFRFGKTELTRIQPHSGGYVQVETDGNQILLNPRNRVNPFRVLSLGQIQSGQLDPNWIRGKIVLIGMMSFSAKDLVSSGAIVGINPGQIHGIEMQAHSTSQIISAVLDQRSLLQVWNKPWEYLWIIVWGVLGISLGRFLRSPWKILFGLGIASVSLIGICFGLILVGWWVPVVPALLVLVLNGAGLTAALFYRYDQELRLRLQERQFVIEQTFNAIHSGPLQTLVGMLRTAQTQAPPSPLLPDLQRLEQELRDVYDSMEREALDEEPHLRMSGEIELILRAPLHELLYKVYSNTLRKELPYLNTIKYKFVQFDPLNTARLKLEHKRGLCRFLEEALCNVGKHATDATRLTVLCIQEDNQQILRVIDNGRGDSSYLETLESVELNQGTANQMPIAQAPHSGLGTKLAKSLAKQLGGKFQRYPNQPRGTVCELIWSSKRWWLW